MSWLLLVAAYGLVKSNDNWQYQSDEALLSVGTTQVPLAPPLFELFENETAI